MKFDVTVDHEGRFARVRVEGDAGAGRLLSLLQLLELDCRSWPEPAVLVDLRAVQLDASPADQVQIAQAAARAFKRMDRVALLALPGRLREAGGVRLFDEELAAQAWLRAP